MVLISDATLAAVITIPILIAALGNARVLAIFLPPFCDVSLYHTLYHTFHNINSAPLTVLKDSRVV